jgi:hypothetical protein
MKSAEHVPGVGLQYVESMRRYAQDAVEHNPLNPQG